MTTIQADPNPIVVDTGEGEFWFEVSAGTDGKPMHSLQTIRATSP